MRESKLAAIEALDEEIRELYSKKSGIIRKIESKEAARNALKAKYNLEKSTAHNAVDWSTDDYPWSADIIKILQKDFKICSFRMQQKAAINVILSKKNLLLVMPTGGGKTLCYQLPALYTKGVTIVISPLLSLMEDQIMGLKKLNITAYSMNSGTSTEDKKIVFNYLNKKVGKPIHLIYVTPEWLIKSKRFMSGLQKCHAARILDRFAVDEVHCCSQWGHDFRPDYRYLSILKTTFSDVPIMGLTATASTAVLLDIQEMLDIEGCIILQTPIYRPNLCFKIVEKPEHNDDTINYLVDYMQKSKKSGIIYTNTIKDCMALAVDLREKGLRVHHYHADLDRAKRLKVHQKWMNNDYQVIVATVAFGMGIDKPDVRFVIHHTVPRSIESLYQEAGRAGRDGERAECIVMYRLADYIKHSSYAKSKTEIKNCVDVLRYCLNVSECRHNLLGQHFDKDFDVITCKTACDHCESPSKIAVYDITAAYHQIMTVIDKANAAEINLTLLKLLDMWLKDKTYKALISRQQAEFLVGNLIVRGYIKEERSYTAYSVHCYLKSNNQFYPTSSTNIEIEIAENEKLTSYLSDANKKRKLQIEHKTTHTKKKKKDSESQ